MLKTKKLSTNARATRDDEAKKQKEEKAREGTQYAIRGNDCLSRGDLKGAVHYHQQYLLPKKSATGLEKGALVAALVTATTPLEISTKL